MHRLIHKGSLGSLGCIILHQGKPWLNNKMTFATFSLRINGPRREKTSLGGGGGGGGGGGLETTKAQTSQL